MLTVQQLIVELEKHEPDRRVIVAIDKDEHDIVAIEASVDGERVVALFTE